jgi:hypothetical protein
MGELEGVNVGHETKDRIKLHHNSILLPVIHVSVGDNKMPSLETRLTQLLAILLDEEVTEPREIVGVPNEYPVIRSVLH